MKSNRLLCFALVLLCGCAGSHCFYSRKEAVIAVSSHNDFMGFGPCGSPWNYDDQINILLPRKGDRFEASQLEAYQNGKLKIDSGFVFMDRTNKKVTIDLTFEGYGPDLEHKPIKCKYNGTHRYVEREPRSGEATRQWLQDFYRTNGTPLYQP